MDLAHGQAIINEMMNNPAYDSSDDEADNVWNSNDPLAMFKALGAGTPGGLPLPSIMTAKEVRTKSRALSTKIFNSWELLNNILARHEATIQKRWMKKTREQRKDILLTAWPKMSLTHRPDYDAFRAKQLGASRREAYMWPYINLEDLLKPKLFLLFLNSRGRNKPDSFARADIDACRFGITSQALVPAFLNLHVMMFTGRHTPSTYGELIAWDDHPEAFDWFHTQKGAHPGEGIFILEIQDRLYKFLLDCCKEILHDMSGDLLTDPNIPLQPEPPSILGNETGLASLATTAAEAPYRLPANLDFKRLESLVKAKLSAAEDHLWALREDPSYHSETMLDWKEHRQECMLDTAGHKHPVLANTSREPILWDRVIGNSICSALGEIEVWNSIHEQIVELQCLKEKYAESISPEKSLPHEYALAFYKLDNHLRQFSKWPIANLKTGFVASPPMRPYFVRMPQDPTNTIIRITNRTGLAKDGSREQLIWIFMTLFDEQQLHLAGLNTLMDELERRMENDPRMKVLISAWVADQISNLAVISQCLHQIELYQPWAASFESEMAAMKDELEADYLRTEKLIAPYVSMKPARPVASLGTPSKGRFNYPVGKRRTRENTEAMRKAENELDAFWQAVDRELMKSSAVSPRLKQLLSQRILQRTPEWIEPVKPPKPETPAAKPYSLIKPLSELHFQLEQIKEQSSTRDKLAQPKIKIKTRGLAQSSETTTGPDSLDQHLADVRSTFPVDKRALKVFKTIFFTPSASSQPGELAWGDFLHAMTCTGFTAEKLYGSV